jgi:translation elongation factor EF-G
MTLAPLITLALVPKTPVDQEKLGRGLGKLISEDPTFRVAEAKDVRDQPPGAG